MTPTEPHAQNDKPGMQIRICMGSSCFSRGNNRNIEVIQSFLQKRTLPPGVELAGYLCQDHCKEGPNVEINGKTYHAVDPIVITGLLNHHLAGGSA